MIAIVARRLLVFARSAGELWRLLVVRACYPQVRLGRGVRIGRGAVLKATDGGTMALGDRVAVAPGAVLVAAGGRLAIGADGFVGEGAFVVARREVTIGPDVLIAEYVVVRDQDHAFDDPQRPIRAQGFTTAPIVIGADVWLGAKASVTKGVTIGDGVVVGAGAVVTGDLPAGAVAVGVPAKVVRSRRPKG